MALAATRVQRFLDCLYDLDHYAEWAVIGQTLVLLLERFEMLTILHDKESDSYSVTGAAGAAPRPVHCVRRDLADALRAHFHPNGERTKRCGARDCRQVKPVSQFSRKKDSADGRNRYCRACESKRASAGRRRKHQREEAAAQQAEREQQAGHG